MSTSTEDIWDLPIRLFHWCLVISIAGLYISAEFTEALTNLFLNRGFFADVMLWHSRLGYFVISLLLFRLLWGFCGSTHARFTRMAFSPKAVFEYLFARTQAKPTSFVGHNPLGSYSVFAMLTLLLSQAISGLFSDDEIAFSGPLAVKVSPDIVEAMTSWHHVNFDILKFLILFHIVAIIVYQFVLKKPLMRRMVIGVKAASTISVNASLLRAAGVYILCVVLVYCVVS